MSSPVQPQPGPDPLSDWMGHSLSTPRSSASSAPRQLDSSFCSEFSPLPASPPRLHTHTPASLEEMLENTQDLPLPLKLQQLRQWQQHMQEQLKAHQRDQQRLLGMELPDYPESPVICGRGFADPVTPAPHPLHAASLPESGTLPCSQQKQCILEAESSSCTLPSPQHDLQPSALSPASLLLDRPIRPGLGIRAQTFEDLLEEQLKLEEQRQKVESPAVQKVHPKRSFLRKREGLSRFSRTSSKPTAQNQIDPQTKCTEPRTKPREPVARPKQTNQKGPQLGGGWRAGRWGHVKQMSSPAHLRPTEPSAPPAHNRTRNQTQRAGRGAAARCDSSGGAEPKPSSAAAPPLQDQTVGTRMQRKTATQAAHTHTHTHTLLHAPEPHTHTHTHTLLHAPAPHTHAPAPHAQALSPRRPPVAMETSFEVWQQERQREWAELGEFELLEAAAEELSFSSCSSSFLQALRHTHTHTHARRLSSTPIKTHPHTHSPDTHTHIPAAHTHSPDTHTHTHSTKQPLCQAAADDEGDDGRGPGSHGDDDEDEEDMTQVAPNIHCLPVTTPTYDSCTYQEPEAVGQEEESACLSDGVEVEFDDDDTWTDISQHAVKPERTLKRKVAMAKVGESVPSQAGEEREAPPTSQLVAKLFPGLQPRSAPPAVTQTSLQPIRSEESEGVCGAVRERLVQMELEIERFRMESAELARLRRSLNTQQEELRKEKAEFEEKRTQMEAEWAEFKQAEMRKLQRDRNLFEKHSAAARNTHTSAQREEIQAVKQQLCDLREECVRKEQRWRNTHTRLQQQVHTLTTHNQELRQQIHTLENLRLTAWKTQQEMKKGEERRREGKRGGQRKTDGNGEERRGKPKASSPESNGSSGDSSFGGNTTNSGTLSPDDVTDATSPGHVCDDVTFIGRVQHAELPAAPGGKFADQQEEIAHPDGKVERVFSDGSRLLLFPNGTQKLVCTDGSTRVTFFNGDVKEVCHDQKVVYYFADAQTTHTTFPDGTELLQFPNKQTEKLYPDGKKEIVFPDQTLKTLYPDGVEESVLPDGTIIRLNAQRGMREVVFVSGEREQHTLAWRRRVYADGTVKTVYADGRQETNYASGRVRIKDPQGRVVKDTHTP